MKTQRANILKLLTVVLILHASQLNDALAGTRSRSIDTEDRRFIFPLVEPDSSGLTDSSPGISVVFDGTDEGIRSLLDRECDLAMASRKMRMEEMKEAEDKGMDIRETSIGEVGIAVAVHPANCIDELTIDQVRKIFDGTLVTWNQVGGANQPISLVTVGTQGSRITGYLSQERPGAPVRQIASQEKQALDESNEVALVHLRNKEPGPKVKFLAIKRSKQSPGVLPTPKEVRCGNYAFVQPLYLYIDWRHATDQAKAFFTFCATQKDKAADE